MLSVPTQVACIHLQITAFTVDELEVPEPRGSASVRNQDIAVENCPYMRCIACTRGDNTVGHWIRWCKVPIVALRNLTNDTTISSLLEGSRKVRDISQLLPGSPPISPTFTRSWSHEASSCCSIDSHRNLDCEPYPKGPCRSTSDLRLAHVRMQQINAVCDLDDSSLICQDKSPLHISCTLAPARVCSAMKTCHTNQTVGVVQLGSEAVN